MILVSAAVQNPSTCQANYSESQSSIAFHRCRQQGLLGFEMRRNKRGTKWRSSTTKKKARGSALYQHALLQGKCRLSIVILRDSEMMWTEEFDHSSSKAPKRSLFGSSDLSPLSASAYFTQALQIEPQDHVCSFRTYYTPSVVRPSAQSDLKGKNASVLVCHHGAGSSGTTFAALAKEVHDKSSGELGVLAFDARGHGKFRLAQLSETVCFLTFAH